MKRMVILIIMVLSLSGCDIFWACHEETWTEDGSGLEWQNPTSDEGFPWHGAVQYCNNLQWAGKTGWRIPSFNELLTLYESNQNGWCNWKRGLSGDCESHYWTSDPDYGNKAYAIDFSEGKTPVKDEDHSFFTDSSFSVRCVRPASGYPDAGDEDIKADLPTDWMPDAPDGNECDGTCSPWTTKTSMPVARWGMGVAVLNDKIYVIGGVDENRNPVATIEEYDPTTDEWTFKHDMEEVRTPAAIVVSELDPVANIIYVIGYSKVDGYDPSTEDWIPMASMNIERNPYVAVVNNKIYAVGGYNNEMGSLATNEEYDPLNDLWTIKTSMPTARNGAPVAAANGKVYAIGGEYFPNNPLSTVEEYDPSTNGWTTKLNMPTARRGAAAVAIDNKIYVIGGTDDSSDLSTVELYDPLNNNWTVKTDMITAREFLGLAVVNNKIYAIGGLNSSGALTTVEEYDPSLDL